MKRRDIVCLDYGHSTKRAALVLRERGWRPCVAQNLSEAEQLMISKQAGVALVGFGAGVYDDNDTEALEALFENTAQGAWVALVEPELLETNAIPRLIANYFYDYLTTPLHAERLLLSVGHAYGMARMSAAIFRFETDLCQTDSVMLAGSDIMKKMVRTLKKCARSSAPVTITGESGTGKEVAAIEIHRRSNQADGPFIAVNCGAIPENLIQSELFGYTKGAFTGADRDKIGRIEAARDGTLFLDEIGDLSLGMQVSLLRFLQEGVIEKVGSHRPLKVNTRIIAATHKDLEIAVQQGEFREDLFYRLNVLRVELPALRERGEDIEALAQAYLARFCSSHGGGAKGFSLQSLTAVNRHDWPGNVRELINRVQRAVVMSDRQLLAPEDLGLDQGVTKRQPKTLDEARADAEKDALKRTLSQTGHNISETARLLGVSRLTVYRLLEKHQLNDRDLPIHQQGNT